MSSGQKALQSVLMRLFANQGAHGWDPLQGRRLAGLFDYGTWISPQPDRIIMGSNVAHRMCGYLLPYTKHDDRHPQCAGIPGLRLTAYATYGYRLKHLPTGTDIEVRDGQGNWSPRSREQALDAGRRMHRRQEERSYRSVWREPDLTAAERRWAATWQTQDHTELVSALFCAQSIFLRDPGASSFEAGGWARHLQLSCSGRAGIPSVLTWCEGLDPGRVAGYLDAVGLVVPGSVRTEAACANYATIAQNGTVVEMHRRLSCMQCHLDNTFEPAQPQRSAA